jgi:NSS family neurotransmitter:Na+ symporter
VKQRETLGSRLGFILISVGCAVGIGNVWKFPWLVGQYGGGFFVLIYLVLSMPCALGFNVWSFVQPFGKGTGIMDLEDFLVSNLILPGGAVVFVLFCTWNKIGWGWDNFLNEANKGKGLKVAHGMRFYCTFILPVLIAFLIIFGLVTFFK